MFKKGFSCKKCGLKFEDRKALGTHIYYEHNDKSKKDVIIPTTAIKDAKYMSEGQYTRLTCEGFLTKKGFVIEKVKLA